MTRHCERTLSRKVVWLCGMFLLLTCGCVTKIPPPVSPTETISLELATKRLLRNMQSNPRFAEKYAVAKSAKCELPVLVVGEIDAADEDNRILDRLDAVGETVRVALYDSGMFDVDAIGAHESPDFVLQVDLRRFSGAATYRLRLALLSRDKDTVLWEGIQNGVNL